MSGSWAPRTCRPAATAATAPGWARPPWTPASSGRSCARWPRAPRASAELIAPPYSCRVKSPRLDMEAGRVRDRIARGDPFWPAQAAVAAAVLLSLLLADPLTVGPRFLLPGVEALLLVVLVTVVPRRA